jgi:hypothetical protein
MKSPNRTGVCFQGSMLPSFSGFLTAVRTLRIGHTLPPGFLSLVSWDLGPILLTSRLCGATPRPLQIFHSSLSIEGPCSTPLGHTMRPRRWGIDWYRPLTSPAHFCLTDSTTADCRQRLCEIGTSERDCRWNRRVESPNNVQD